jgi:hypothetical protein
VKTVNDGASAARAQWSAPLLKSAQQSASAETLPSVEDLMAQAQSAGLEEEAMDAVRRGADLGADRKQVQARLFQLMQTYGLQPRAAL